MKEVAQDIKDNGENDDSLVFMAQIYEKRVNSLKPRITLSVPRSLTHALMMR